MTSAVLEREFEVMETIKGLVHPDIFKLLRGLWNLLTAAALMTR